MRINEPMRRITYKLKHVMNAKKINGDVINELTNKRVSCPTWRFKSDPQQYVVKEATQGK